MCKRSTFVAWVRFSDAIALSPAAIATFAVCSNSLTVGLDSIADPLVVFACKGYVHNPEHVDTRVKNI